jgi:hypothetical protein
MKTAELVGAQLDYWVGKAENVRRKQICGPKIWERNVEIRPHSRGGVCWQEAGHKWQKYRPSSDWKFGNVIVERERISLVPLVPCMEERGLKWRGIVINDATPIPTMFDADGPTLLIAAMRAYVTKMFGKEVPDE